MDYKELLEGLKNIETEKVELKRSFSEWEEIAQTIAGFATQKGGKIFVGIDRNACPVGTTCSNEIKGRLQGLANQEIKPAASISTELVNHDSSQSLVIAIIHVQKGNGVHSYKGIHYQRRGDTNHALNSEEICTIERATKKLYYDEMPCNSEERPALISDIDENKVSEHLTSIKKIQGQHDIKRFLINNSYLVNGGQQVKNSAIMIFGKDPQKFIPQMRVSMSSFAGRNVTDRFVKKEFTGDINNIFQAAFLEIQKNMKVYSFIEGKQRIDVHEYPLEVVRECLINAIVHRDYYERSTETFVKIFTDRMEFVNPASFPFENTTFDEIRKTKSSRRRNPVIAEFFESLGLMEKEGMGVSKIEEGMTRHGLPLPVFNVYGNTFMVTLKSVENKNVFMNSPYRKVIDFGLLNERQNVLIEHLNRTNIRYISRREYIALIIGKNIQITELTASRDLQELVMKNVLTKYGDKKGTKYLLT
ncbi:MAG TPA: ATP-binding protein [Candidatus Nanoarchaeia archaeon]|nr:ATP-binding protein [Candidatus Nanoarchaeia archaeon]